MRLVSALLCRVIMSSRYGPHFLGLLFSAKLTLWDWNTLALWTGRCAVHLLRAKVRYGWEPSRLLSVDKVAMATLYLLQSYAFLLVGESEQRPHFKTANKLEVTRKGQSFCYGAIQRYSFVLGTVVCMTVLRATECPTSQTMGQAILYVLSPRLNWH